MLARLSPAQQDCLVDAMLTVERLLGGCPPSAEPFNPADRTGPATWAGVIHRHGAIYTQEYGWDERFEALVAAIAAKFIHEFDSKRERCWIAEKDGAIIECVFLVKKSRRRRATSGWVRS
jgi:hypothetical protein